MFLDFDGTLVPLAPRPQDVVVPSWVVPRLGALTTRLGGALAIVSGRPLAQLDHYLAPLVLPAAGSHGAEWRDSAGRVERHDTPPPASVLEAARRLTQHDGLILETKPGGFALHYRARPELESICRETLGAALAAAPGAASAWAWLHGHFVFELRQRGITKGVAVRRLLGQAAFAGRLPVFVGDDQTDEDGIEAVQAAGGFGVRVGGGASQARYELHDVAAVGAWLANAGPAPAQVGA
ncbi:MAG: trehalose-phosphatase [Pseudomonadota bacterium]|nr:trehalose-phosphatase [Pseudomonadota bacterium]